MKIKNNLAAQRLSLIAAIIGAMVAVFSAVQMIGSIRVVDILTLFFGGFSAGAGLIKLIMDYRIKKTDTDSAAHEV